MSIKKIIVTCIGILFFGFSANAQISAVGGRVGLGTASISDDLLTHSTLGYNLGGYVNYAFSIGALPEMELQSGLFLARRGGKMVKEDLISSLEEIYHPWYLQIPLLLVYTYRLPIQDEHFVSFSIGPAANVGMFGKCQRTIISPDYVGIWGPDRNSRTEYDMFGPWEKLDVSLVIGLGYRFRDLTFDIMFDSGFIVPAFEADALYPERNSFSGTQQTVTFMLGYHFGIK